MAFLRLFLITFLFQSVFSTAAFAEVKTYFNRMQSERAKIDPSKYEVIKLKNGMDVVVYSNPQVKKASAAISVNVGAYKDPEGQRGFFHFLEHVLFLGTEKYPVADEFLPFLLANQGTSNAGTMGSDTTYHFDIIPDKLDEALDRLSYFFKKPLFNENFIEKELKAVQGEYDQNIAKDGRRMLYIVRELYVDGSSQKNRFQGNIETLKNSTKRELFVDAFNKYYRANQMKATIIGPQSIEELKTLAQKHFADIPTGSDQTTYTFDQFEMKNGVPFLQFNTVEDGNRLLVLQYPMIINKSDWKDKSSSILVSALNSQAKGGLVEQLKANGWISTLEGDIFGETNSVSEPFGIYITLTEKGEQNWKQILKTVEEYLVFLRDHISLEKMREFKRQSELKYVYGVRVLNDEMANDIARHMHRYSSDDVLEKSELLPAANILKVKQLISELLSRKNMVISLGTPGYKGKLSSDFYDISYDKGAFSQTEMASWPSLNLQYKIWPASDFVPKTFAKLNVKNGEQVKSSVAMGIPYEAVENSKYLNPTAMLNLQIELPRIATAKEAALFMMSDSIAKEILKPIIDEAEKYVGSVAFDGTISPLWRIMVSGFSDTAEKILLATLHQLMTGHISDEQFATVKQDAINNLNALHIKDAYGQGRIAVRELRNRNLFPSEQVLTVLPSVSKQDVLQYLRQQLSQSFMKVQSFGHFSEQQTLALIGKVSKTLKRQSSAQPSGVSVVSLKPAQKISRIVNRRGPNNAIFVLIEGGAITDYEKRAFGKFYEAIVSQEFYQEMRTRQNFGYIAMSAHVEEFENNVYLFTLQTARSLDEVFAVVNPWISNTITQLFSDVSDEDFESVKQGILYELEQEASSIAEAGAEQFRRWAYFNESVQEKAKFIAAVKALTKQHAVKISKEIFSAENQKRWSAYVVGKDAKVPQLPSDEVEVKDPKTLH